MLIEMGVEELPGCVPEIGGVKVPNPDELPVGPAVELWLVIG